MQRDIPKGFARPKAFVRMGVAVSLGALMLAAAGVRPAKADVTVYDKDGKKLALTLGAGFGLFEVTNPNFGAGFTKTNGGTYNTARWAEGFAAPGVVGSIDTGSAGSFYGGATVVGAATRGSGEPSGGTQDNPNRARFDQAYAGWKSGKLFSALGTDAFDLSAGRQSFVVGDGFLLADGTADGGKNAAYYLAPRSAFANSVILRTNTNPVRADLFWLKTDKVSGDDRIEGANVEFKADKLGTLGAMYAYLPYSGTAQRKGMKVYDLRGQGTPLSMLPDLFLSAEYTKEHNSDTNGKLDAYAWYGEAGYTLSSVPWKPTLSYRYAHFSGDNLSTSKSEGFQSLHYSNPRGWGTWFMGEIAGQYLLANSNENVNMIHLTATPTDKLATGVAFYDFRYDQEPAGVTSKDFGREIDVHADYTLTSWMTVSGAVGRLTPGDGAKQAYGGSRASNLVELFTYLKF